MCWVQDGGSIVYSLQRQSIGNLYRIHLRGSVEPDIISLAGEGAFSPAASRIGHRLLYARYTQDYDMFRVEPRGAPKSFMTSTADDYGPQYSPDGKKVLFLSSRSGGSREVFTANADGSNPVQLTKDAIAGGSANWSPDGRWIVFESYRKSNWDIYVMDSSGGQLRPLAEDPRDDLFGNWSRDGRSVHFASARNNGYRLYRVSWPEGGEPVQITNAGATVSMQSLDGRTLYYTRSWSSNQTLFSQPTGGGAEQRVLEGLYGGAFVPYSHGIFYIAQTSVPGEYALQSYEFLTRKSRSIARFRERPSEAPISVSPDGKTILYSAATGVRSDLMLIENFR